MRTWAHLHLPRLRSGDTPNVISVKIPGQRIEYASWVSLRNAEFKVSESGRRRCIVQGVRNVHAWVVGTEVCRVTEENGLPLPSAPATWRRAVYDPWKGAEFVDAETLEPVLVADLVIMRGKNVYYVNLRD